MVLKRYFLFLLVIGMINCVAANAKGNVNVVFFFVDDLGWTDLSCFGSDLYKTPNVDKLAAMGMKFTNAYSSCTVCSPSRASIMTGKYPARINCTDWIEGWKYPYAQLKVPDWTMYMKASEYTMAEAFKDAGYKTIHIGKWHLGEDEIHWPENHGFDTNIGGWKKGAPNRSKKEGYTGYFSPYGNPRLDDGPDGEYLTERLANEASNFIDDNAEQTFFLNLWFYNVHTPLQAKKDKIERYRALIDTSANHQNPVYAAMVEHMDDAIGTVLNKLKEKNLIENTIIVFSSDNGGLVPRKNKITSNAPLRSGKGDIYEGGVRVPAIVVAPGVTKENSISNIPVISMDFYPTLMELAGIDIPQSVGAEIDGRSLVKVLKGKKNLDRESLFWHYPHYHIQGATPYSAVRKGNYKLIHLMESNAYELYNLADDIGEQENLIEKLPEVKAELLSVLDNWKKEVNAQMPSPNSNFDPNNPRGFGKKKISH